MLVPGSVNPLLAFTSAAAAEYQISRSLRFNSSDSAYCARSFGTPTTQGTFTFSVWVKRSVLSSTQQLFGVSTNHSFGFTSGDSLNLTFGGVSALTTTAKFRDPGAWYHIVWRQSGTSHTLYVNNVTVGTVTATSSVFNTAVAHQIGSANTTNFFNGYLANIHFIDGQALTPSSFGQTDVNGEWQPIAYTSTYGTNGFELNFADNSAATAAALGKDTSGNSPANNWTPNNLSVTAGNGNDSLVDTPTSYGTDTGVGGEVRGNYAVINSLSTDAVSGIVNGNLDFSASFASATYIFASTIPMRSGKWYCEYTMTTILNSPDVGILLASSQTKNLTSFNNVFPVGQVCNGYSYRDNGEKVAQGVSSAYGASYTDGNIIGIAFDADNGTLTFYKNGTSQGVAFTGIPAQSWLFAAGLTKGPTAQPQALTANFGQRPFAYTAPSGFKALCDTNLPDPVIAKPSTVMDAALYTGTGSALTATSSLGFNPDFVWIKGRSGATDHALYDALRGATLDLVSNSIAAETTQTQGLTAFNSNGFNVGTLAKVNTSSATYAAWCWDAGSSNVVNTQGSITSTVRANPSAGFSVVTYTGIGGTRTVGHGLGVTPSMIIVKCRSNADDWAVKHTSLTAGQYLYLNTTNAPATSPNLWNTTNPTASVFTVAGDSHVNGGALTYVAYCFAPVAGYSAFGSYTGNGNTDGPFVYTEFRPRYLIVKRTTAATTGEWWIWDSSRIPYNYTAGTLSANSSANENPGGDCDFLSNGFKLRVTNTNANGSSDTYIYAAFAEFPFQYARAR